MKNKLKNEELELYLKWLKDCKNDTQIKRLIKVIWSDAQKDTK